jgi:hypothetical protein
MKEGLAVNRGERMRWRAFNIHARRGEFERYWALVNLSLEPVRDGVPVE